MAKEAVKKETKKTKETKNLKKNKKVVKTKKENYFKGVKKEMKLVKWPTFRDVLKNTIATIVFCAVVCAFFLLLNLILSVVKGWF